MTSMKLSQYINNFVNEKLLINKNITPDSATIVKIPIE